MCNGPRGGEVPIKARETQEAEAETRTERQKDKRRDEGDLLFSGYDGALFRLFQSSSFLR